MSVPFRITHSGCFHYTSPLLYNGQQYSNEVDTGKSAYI